MHAVNLSSRSVRGMGWLGLGRGLVIERGVVVRVRRTERELRLMMACSCSFVSGNANSMGLSPLTTTLGRAALTPPEAYLDVHLCTVRTTVGAAEFPQSEVDTEQWCDE